MKAFFVSAIKNSIIVVAALIICFLSGCHKDSYTEEQRVEDYEINRENSIPTFKFETPLSVTVYYEDEYSLSTRLDMYSRMGVNNVGFWRLGQETQEVWKLIELEGK